MPRALTEIVREAIELSERQRLRVIERLLASLDDKRERDIDASWAEEVEARSRDIKHGGVRPLSWTEVRARARRRARERR